MAAQLAAALNTATPPHIRAMGRSRSIPESEGQTHMTRETGLHLVSLGFRVCGSCQFRGFPQHTFGAYGTPERCGTLGVRQ